jgi:hypothetical protein
MTIYYTVYIIGQSHRSNRDDAQTHKDPESSHPSKHQTTTHLFPPPIETNVALGLSSLPIDPAIFGEAALLQLIRLQTAFEKLSSVNKGVTVSLVGLTKLEVANKEGSMLL